MICQFQMVRIGSRKIHVIVQYSPYHIKVLCQYIRIHFVDAIFIIMHFAKMAKHQSVVNGGPIQGCQPE